METAKTHYVIFHINETGKGTTLVAGIKNLQADFGGETLFVEALANPDGVLEFLKDRNIGHEVRRLAGCGVVFAVCANSMSARGIRQDQLMQPVNPVGSGVGGAGQTPGGRYPYLKI